MPRDYYQILGVPKNSTQEEIKKAYRRLAHQFHPDKGGDEKKFKEINEAYGILGDDKKRAQYDQFGRVFEGASARGGASGFPGFDFSNFSGSPDLEGALGDIFGDFFGFSSGSKKGKRGQDIVLEVGISLGDAFAGTKEVLEIEKFVACGICGGSGAALGSTRKTCQMCSGKGRVEEISNSVFGAFARRATCPNCRGLGTVAEKPCTACKGQGRKRHVLPQEIVIPAGVEDGTELTFSGQGEAGEAGLSAGDLVIRVRVQQHAIFKRHGSDLYSRIEVPYTAAVLGGSVDAKTIDGSVKLKIPSGTVSGKVFRLREKGMPRFSQGGRGDAYVTAHVAVPKNISKRAKDLLEELRQEGL